MAIRLSSVPIFLALGAGVLTAQAPNLESIHVRLGPPAYPRMAMDSEGATVRLPERPKRVVSMNHGADEFLYQIAPPEQIVGVSSFAYDDLSAILPKVKQYQPGIARGLDSILALKPDLVLAADGSSLETVNALRDAKIPVFRLQNTPTALEQIAAEVVAIGYLTGNDESAQRELKRFNDEFAAIRAQCSKPHVPARIFAVSMTGFSYGDQTLFQEIIRLLRDVNVAAEGGMHTYERVDNKTIASWSPDWVFTWAVPERAAAELSRWQEDASLARTPATKSKQVVVSEPKVLLPLSSLVTGFARLMADRTCVSQ